MVKHQPDRRSMIRMKALCAAAVLLAPAVAAMAQGGGPPPTPVRVAEVRSEVVQEHRRVTGELRAVQRSDVASLEEGRVEQVSVDEGQAVVRGAVLAVLDTRRARLDLARLEAERQVADAMVLVRRSELEIAQRDHDAVKELDEKGAANPKEYGDAIAELRIAEARLVESERNLDVLAARIDLARTKIDDATITAPFDGVVVKVHTEQGQWIGVGETVLELVSTGSYDAWLDVPQEFAEVLSGNGAKVQVLVEAVAKSFAEAKPTIVRTVDPTARTFQAFIRLEDPEDRLFAGMSVLGMVPMGDRTEHLTLPKDALMRNDAGMFVYVLRQNQPDAPALATPVQVAPLFMVNDRMAVRARDLDAGDLVVVEGNERLFPSMPVTPNNGVGETKEGADP
jgi:RND family efflux transporter MFP subunit